MGSPMSSETQNAPVIAARDLGKAYLVYARPGDRLLQIIAPRLRRAVSRITRLILGRTLAEREYFTRHWALRDVNLTVMPGETVGVIGRNGSGKSTLLQLVSGTLNATEGEVTVKGRVAALLELGSGFNPEYTGRENVYLNASVLGLSREETDARLSDILEFADIGSFIDQPVKTYSSGMAMRLAFAVIAHVDADLLIIDEALAVGDAAFQQKCQRWLRRFREHGTVLFCGHDLSAVINLCRHAIWLDQGVVRLAGPAAEVAEAYLDSVRAETAGVVPSTPAGSRAPETARRPTPPAPLPDGSAKGLGALPQFLDISAYNPDSRATGTGDATVTGVRLASVDGSELNLITGGEMVAVDVEVRANAELYHPILGFHVKDRLGQPLFGDNTHLTYVTQDVVVPAGGTLRARFVFALPLLRSGDYAMTAAVATGTLEEFVVHHWVHDALFFTVHSPVTTGVMVGIPMADIQLTWN